jgi:hypothetical protein
VPLPANYVRGIDMQKRDFEVGLVSYLGGVQRRPGWWYYYLYAAAVKMPLGTWFLGAIAFALTLRRRRAPGAADELVLWAPALVVLALVSSQTGFNRHIRYVLPALPFYIIWASKSGCLIAGPRRAYAACILLAATGSAASSLAVYPHSLSYFNEAAGGPAHLLDSNIDWGQDLLALRRWFDLHPEAAGLKLAYFGPTPPRLAGIDAPMPPRGPTGRREDIDRIGDLGPHPGWFAVSVNYLYGYQHSPNDGAYFTYFRLFKPVAMAGYSIYIYHLSRTEAEEARGRLGLPPIEDRGRTPAWDRAEPPDRGSLLRWPARGVRPSAPLLAARCNPWAARFSVRPGYSPSPGAHGGRLLAGTVDHGPTPRRRGPPARKLASGLRSRQR